MKLANVVFTLFLAAQVMAEGSLRSTTTRQDSCISRKEMVDRINSFKDAVPSISQLYWTNGGGAPGSQSEAGCREAYKLSKAALFGAYGYPKTVNFKPTITAKPYTFRTTTRSALSYFIGTECLTLVGRRSEQFPPGNIDGSVFKELGFALNNNKGRKGWVEPTLFNPNEWFFHIGGAFCRTSMAMGQLCFTQGDESGLVCVDKTFAFNRAKNGNVVIVAHHSSAVIPLKDSTTICVGATCANTTYSK